MIERLKNPDIPPLDINNRGAGYVPLREDSDLFFFFVQAEDEDVRELIVQLKETYPSSTRASQYQMLNLLARWPEFAPQQLEVIRPEVKEFLDPLRSESISVLESEAKAAWQTFGFDQADEEGEGTP